MLIEPPFSELPQAVNPSHGVENKSNEKHRLGLVNGNQVSPQGDIG